MLRQRCSWFEQHRVQTFAHARVVRRRSRRKSTDDDDSTSLPMVVDCSDTSLVGILHNFHCEHLLFSGPSSRL